MRMSRVAASTLRSDQGILKHSCETMPRSSSCVASTLRSDQGILKPGAACRGLRVKKCASTLRSDQGILKQEFQAQQARHLTVPQPYDPTRGY